MDQCRPGLFLLSVSPFLVFVVLPKGSQVQVRRIAIPPFMAERQLKVAANTNIGKINGIRAMFSRHQHRHIGVGYLESVRGLKCQGFYCFNICLAPIVCPYLFNSFSAIR
jgi:hypothetical protein